MTRLDQLTAVVLTYNEAPNLERTLRSLGWAGRIVLVDSGSTDGTLDIARKFPRCEAFVRPFDNHAGQWNFGLSHVTTDWVLASDADYVFPPSARNAIEAAMSGSLVGYRAGFEYLVHGRPIRGSILPPRTVLFRTRLGSYRMDGHTQRLSVQGETGQLPFTIAHDDRKSIGRWLRSQVSYARLEAEKLAATPARQLGMNDRLRKKIVLAPMLVFVLVYILRGGFLSGWRGFYYAVQRCAAETMLSLFLLDRKLGGGPS